MSGRARLYVRRHQHALARVRDEEVVTGSPVQPTPEIYKPRFFHGIENRELWLFFEMLMKDAVNPMNRVNVFQNSKGAVKQEIMVSTSTPRVYQQLGNMWVSRFVAKQTSYITGITARLWRR